MDVGCYCVSAIRLLLGEPERALAESVNGANGVDGRMAGVLRCAGGALGLFECAFDTVPHFGIEVIGLEGTLTIEDPWHGWNPGIVRTAAGGEREAIEVEGVNPYAREVDDLSQAVRGGSPPRLGRADAVGQARTIEALYRSAAEGRAITV
jgi:predicted dehydrogenase